MTLGGPPPVAVAGALAATRLAAVAAMGGRTLRSASVAAADAGRHSGLDGAVLLRPPQEVDGDEVRAELASFFGARLAGPPTLWSPWGRSARNPAGRVRALLCRDPREPVLHDPLYDVREVADGGGLATWLDTHRRGCADAPDEGWLDAAVVVGGCLRLFVARTAATGEPVATAAAAATPDDGTVVVDFVTRAPGAPRAAAAAATARAAGALGPNATLVLSDEGVLPGWRLVGHLHGSPAGWAQPGGPAGGTGR